MHAVWPEQNSTNSSHWDFLFFCFSTIKMNDLPRIVFFKFFFLKTLFLASFAKIKMFSYHRFSVLYVSFAIYKSRTNFFSAQERKMNEKKNTSTEQMRKEERGNDGQQKINPHRQQEKSKSNRKVSDKRMRWYKSYNVCVCLSAVKAVKAIQYKSESWSTDQNHIHTYANTTFDK